MIAEVKRFLLSLEASGCSGRTVEWYADKLYQIAAELSNSPPPPPADVTIDDLRRVVVAVRRRGLSEWTVHGYVRSIRRFFSWCVAEGILGENPAERLKLPDLPCPDPKAVELDDVRRLLAAAREGPAECAVRDYALVLTLLDTGCRAGEIVGMDIADLNLGRGMVRVRGKGRKVRVVGLNSVTCEAIREWLAVRPEGKDQRALWVGRRGRLTVSGLGNVLRRLKRISGVTGRCNPHSFRHRFTIEFLMNGGSLGEAADILGHSDIEVTKMFYGRITRNHLLERQRQFSPVAHLGDRDADKGAVSLS